MSIFNREGSVSKVIAGQEKRRSDFGTGNEAQSLAGRSRLLDAIKERKLASKLEGVDIDIDSEQVRRETQPQFVDVFAEQKSGQAELEHELTEAEQNLAILKLIGPDAQQRAWDDAEKLRQIDAVEARLEQEGKTRQTLEQQVKEARKGRIDYLDRKSRGELVSSAAIRTHEEWEENETLATALQVALKEKLGSEESRQALLGEDMSPEALQKRQEILSGLVDIAQAASAASQKSIILLKRLARQASGAVRGANGEIDLEQEIVAHAEKETAQMYGVEIQLSVEEELVTSEVVKATYERILAESGIDSSYADGKHGRSLMRELGVVTEVDDESGEEVFSLKENSVLRAVLLSRDSVQALRTSLEQNLDNEDADYSLAAFSSAEELLQVQAEQMMVESVMQRSINSVYAEQQSVIKREIGDIEKAEAIDAKRTKSAKRRQAMVRLVRMKVKSTIDSISATASQFIGERAKVEGRQARQEERETRLSELRGLVSEESQQ